MEEVFGTYHKEHKSFGANRARKSFKKATSFINGLELGLLLLPILIFSQSKAGSTSEALDHCERKPLDNMTRGYL